MHTLNRTQDFEYITFPSLQGYGGLFHCFTTRKGGVSSEEFASMNLGMGTGDDVENVEKNYEIMSKRLGIRLKDIVETDQTHTNNVRYVTDKDKGRAMKDPDYNDVDGLYTDIRNIALMTFHADCTPLFFYDTVKNAIGMAHAGWRGTLQNIAGKMIDAMVKDLGCNPKDMKAVIGPSLGQCCFEVDEDVAAMFLSYDSSYSELMVKKGEKFHFDLWEINKRLMVKHGMDENSIEVSGLCTKCNRELFFSHRGQKGKRGLMCGIIMLK
ncbi:MAG: peptidoglycan editing factor PgeF [Sedimentibacter sp.]|uniref:peptidoglycan editing factor PgeF n=1 Tax=Sedimentibacter sp. TaxID=1960295 RepID=UPI00315980BC